MNNIALWISMLADKTLNYVIGFLAVIEFFLFCITFAMMNESKTKIQKLNEKKTEAVRSTRKNKDTVDTVYVSSQEKDWTKYEAAKKDYDEKCSIYSMFSLLIQLFPLLGILGTVCGLFIALQDQQTSNLYTGVGFALSSTIYGIIAAVIFKIMDIVLESFVLSSIDAGIERFEADYTHSKSDALLSRYGNQAEE